MVGYTREERLRMEGEQLAEKLRNLNRDELPPANIIVAGICGSGKSTLLNAVFKENLAETGKGDAVTTRMNEYKSESLPIHVWDTVGLELDSEKTKKSIEEIKRTISDKAEQKDTLDRIHAIWYCIDSGSHRYQSAELNFVRELHALGVPFIIVLTQCTEAQEEIDEFAEIIRKKNKEAGLDDIDVVPVCAKEYRLRGFTVDAFGLEVLVDKTMAMLPEFIMSGFAAAQKVSKQHKRGQAEKIIYTYVRIAKYGFWDKVPGFNLISANKRIISMYKKIANIYNTDISEKGLERITSECSIDWDNAFNGLITPFKKKYYKKAMSRLEASRKDGFDVAIDELKQTDRVAVMVAFYGYTYVEAIEEMWRKFTEEQLKDMQIVVDNMVSIINRILRENNRK